MGILQSSVYAIAIGLCAFSAILVSQSKSELPTRFFFAFLAIQATVFTFEWLMIHPAIPYTMFWLFGVMALSLLISPSVWAFARDLSGEKLTLNLRCLAPHLSVIILGVLLLVPLFSTLFPNGPFLSMRLPGLAQYSLIHVTMLLTVAVFILQSAYYIRQCMLRLAQRTEQNKGLFAQVSDVGTNTLRILVLAVLANCLVSVMRVLYCWALDEGPVLNVFFAILQMSCLAYVACAVLRQTFTPNAGLDKERKEIFGSSDTADKSVKKYQNFGLSEERRKTILSCLKRLLQEQHIHHDNQLNLSLLCQHLNESPQLVSQVINQSEYKSFYQMINQHRIADAKTWLKSREETSILQIAYQVGYNSKSTFNNAFKKFEGCSPSEFRRCHTDKAPHSNGLKA